jgi:uncharacterized integral membrane protein
MRWIYRAFSLLLLLAGAGLGVWFYLDNIKTVQLTFFGHAIDNVPLALWLLVFFVTGVVLGLSVSVLQSLRHRVRVQAISRTPIKTHHKRSMKLQ